MTGIEHRLVDGAMLRIDGVAVPFPVTSHAFMRVGDDGSHLFRTKPAGFSRKLEEWFARGDYADRDYRVHDQDERAWRGGSLRIATVSHAAAAGTRRRFSMAFFEHASGCLITARLGRTVTETRARFEMLPIETDSSGVVVRLPVVSDVRPPAALTFVPRLGQLVINPLTQPVLRQLPRTAGRRVARGEVYRVNRLDHSLLFVSETCRVTIAPELGPLDMAVVEQLAVEWTKN